MAEKVEEIWIEEKPKKKRKKTSRRFKPLAKRISGKLENEFKDINPEDRERLVGYLDFLYGRETNRMVRLKTAKIEERLAGTEAIVDSLEEVFRDTNIGMILIDARQKVCFKENTKVLPYKIHKRKPLPKRFLNKLEKFDPAEGLEIESVTIWEISKDDEGNIRSVLFQF